MKPTSRWWKSRRSQDSAACDASTPCSPRFMAARPRRTGGADGPADPVMTPSRRAAALLRRAPPLDTRDDHPARGGDGHLRSEDQHIVLQLDRPELGLTEPV